MVKNKIFIFLLLGIFLIGFTSAAEFDNYIENYDEETETITFSNCAIDLLIGCALDGSDIGQVQLKTLKDFNVARGYNYVWEMDAWLTDETDYNDFLKGFEFEDRKNGNAKINRDIDVKILSYQDVEVEDYYYDCYDVWDATNNSNFETCDKIQNGTHIEQKEVWTKVTPADLRKADGKITLRGYTDVQKGDKVDWSPLIFGVRVGHDIWAVWTEALNVNLQSYYPMEDSSGDLVDVAEGFDLTYNGALYSQPGKVNDAISYDGINDFSQRVTTNLPSGNAARTQNLWFKFNSIDGVANANPLIVGGTYGSTNLMSTLDVQGGLLRFWTHSTVTSSTTTIVAGNWYMGTITHDGTTMRLYVNGVEENSLAITLATSSGQPLYFAYRPLGSGTPYSNVVLDEIGLWDRALSPSEVTQLYNSNIGLTWTDMFGVPPSVTLISPANDSNLTSANIDFITTVTDDEQVDNVTLYIDGVANETNSSGFNGTYTFSKMISEGVHNWSILAIDNSSSENQSETRTFNLTIPPIFIDLLSPADVSTHNTPLVNMSCTAYKDEGVTQLNLTINGVVNISITNSSIAENLTISQELNFSEENYTWGCSAMNPSTSAVSSNRTFEVLYSNPVINLFEPENNSEVLIENVTFIFNVSDVNGVDNVSLFIGGVLNETNISGVDGNYSFFRTLADGFYNWSVGAISTLGKITNSSIGFFLVHTVSPDINISAPTGTMIFIEPGSNETLNYSISEIGVNESEHFVDCWFEYNNTEFLNNISFFTEGVGEIREFNSGYANVTAVNLKQFSNSTTLTNIPANCSRRGNFTLRTVSVINPSSTEIYCKDRFDNNILIDIISGGGIDDANITSMVKRTLNCTGNTSSFEYVNGKNNLCVHAIDEFGLHSENVTNWDYLFEYWTIDLITPQYEGTQGTFVLNTSLSGGATVEEAIFNYNGTNYSTSIITSGGDYLITSSIVLPSVDADTNFTLSFYVVVDGVTYNFLEETQEVLNIEFIPCVGGIDLLMNISLFDEGSKTSILGDIELNIQAHSKTSDGIVAEINATYENISSQEICLSPNASFSNLYINAEMRYFKDDYAAEFYYIQKADLDDYPVNLSLFSLKLNDSTEFSVTYKNNAFIFEEGAIIQLKRRYIGEDISEVVEAPLTGAGGQAVLHIDLNTNRYSASIVKDGELLDFFENIVFSCANELSGDCTYSFDGTVNPNNDIPIQDITDFAYTVSVDEGNQTITVLFAVPSGTPSSINVLLEQKDMFGNFTSCNTTVITSAGSITCDYTDTIEKSILELSISKSNVELAVASYILDPDLDMDGMNFFIAFLFMISLVGMAIASPEWMIIISVMVLIISGTLLLLKGMSLVMGLGAIAWVIVAAAIIIMKMAKQEDR